MWNKRKIKLPVVINALECRLMIFSNSKTVTPHSLVPSYTALGSIIPRSKREFSMSLLSSESSSRLSIYLVTINILVDISSLCMINYNLYTLVNKNKNQTKPGKYL